ncbi:MAG TPA: hypothetical protein ENK18_18170 [Deltaproteobacteria bacterium]|nr:hypothetical protein [Deltaproteobacteria bacterium]
MRWVLTPALLASCAPQHPIRIGSKEFAENRILAELLAQILDDGGLAVERHLDLGDTFACHQGLRSGEIDLYPEYTGTALAVLGLPADHDADTSWSLLRQRTSDLDLSWPVRLGFDNTYVLATTPVVAARHELIRISDLALAPTVTRVASSPEFLQRPIDGFAALQRHYGLPRLASTVVDSDPDVLHRALLQGEVELVVTDATDAWIDEYGLVVLSDDLGFFPAYEAAPVVHSEVLLRHPEIQPLLEQLEGTLTLDEMRRANRSVAIDGRSPRETARELLIEAGLAEGGDEGPREQLVVTVLPGSESPRLTGVALAQIRRILPGLKLVTQAEPGIEAAAELSVLPAPVLFTPGPAGRAQPREDLWALGALGHVAVHWIARAEGSRSWRAARRVGVGPSGSGADRVVALLETMYELELEREHGPREAQLEALDQGELDAVVILDEAGGAEPTLALRDKDRVLLGIDGWIGSDRSFRLPFLRAQRLPADTYPGQPEPLPTVGTQVVLAARHAGPVALGSGGPASALVQRGAVLAPSQLDELSQALDGVPLDPVLPSREAPGAPREATLPMQPAITLTNLATFAYLGLMLWLLIHKQQQLQARVP